MTMKYENTLVRREDFLAWIDLVQGTVYGPDYRSSKIFVRDIKLENGVRLELVATAILKTPFGTFYGRGDYHDHDGTLGYNFVRVNYYFGTAFHLYGDGARSTESWKMAQSLLDVLTGNTD